jgi:hypothetical protein
MCPSRSAADACLRHGGTHGVLRECRLEAADPNIDHRRLLSSMWRTGAGCARRAAPQTLVCGMADGGLRPPPRTRDPMGARRGTNHFSKKSDSHRAVPHYMGSKNRQYELIWYLILRNKYSSPDAHPFHLKGISSIKSGRLCGQACKSRMRTGRSSN